MDLESFEVNILKALAHPIRLRIVKMLREKTYCVCELNEDVEFSQSNLSQHLKILRDSGIVVCEKEGMRINYRVKDSKVFEVLDAVESVVIESIKALKAKLDV